jgi:hypothetical protein
MYDTSTRRNDPVFQLSLTELAFTVAFLLLLLTGVLVAQAERERDAARQGMSEARDEWAQAAAKQAAAEAIRMQIRQEVARAGGPDLDERLSELIRRVEAQAGADTLRARLEEMTTRLVALEALRGTLERAGPEGRDAATRELIEGGIAALRGIESVTGERVSNVQAFEIAARLATDAKRARELMVENARLRGQMAHLRRAAPGEAKGFGLPPCWIDESGRVERLLDVTITDAGLIAQPAWPAERAAAAAAIPGVTALIAPGRHVEVATFLEQARPVYDWSRSRDPECRHYVQVTVAASRVDAAVRGKNAVYALFYPAGPEQLAAGRDAPVPISAP